MAEDARTDALHNAMNHSSFARRVSPLEHDGDLGSGCSHPFLHLDQFGLQFAQLLLVLLFRELRLLLGTVVLSLLLLFRHSLLP